MRAFLSGDMLVSVFLQMLIVIVLFSAYFLGTNAYSSQLDIIEKERKAIAVADYLMFSCKERHGLAKCIKGQVEENEFSVYAVGEFRGYGNAELKSFFGIGKNQALAIAIETMDGAAIYENGIAEGTCINRIGILESRIAILSVCLN